MNIDDYYKEKGLAITQIELWQQRLKVANENISKSMNDASKPKIVGANNAEPGTAA